MVFFTCNHCGESVKKNKVETHAVRCSRSISVSCMDCNKDFDGKTYNGHTQCVTELEKYSPKGTVAKPSSNKGLVKQQAWCFIVNSAIESAENLPADDRKLLTILSKHDNIPRKKNKFENFLKNGIFTGSQDCVNRVWDMLQKKLSEMKNSDNANASTVNTASKSKGKIDEVENTPPKEVNTSASNEEKKLTKKQKKALKKAKFEENVKEPGDNGLGPLTKKAKKGKKRKAGSEDVFSKPSKEEVVAESVNGDASPSPKKKSKKDNFGFTVDTTGNTPLTQKLKKKQKSANASGNSTPSPNKADDKKFDWNDSVVKVLESANNKELPVKILRKKVLAQYVAETSRPITETIKSKFQKRLNQVPGVKAVKGRAVLSSTT